MEAEEVQKIKANVTKDDVILNYRGIKGLNIYKTSSTVMSFFDNLYGLFDSIADLDKAIDEGYFSQSIGREIMYKKNPYGKDFPSKSMELSKSLLIELKLDANFDLDTSLLRIVEGKIRHLPRPYHFYRSNFIQIVALLGEVIKRSHPNLKWKMKLSDDKQTWNPYLIGQSQTEYPFFGDLYEHLFINDRLDDILTFVSEIYM